MSFAPYIHLLRLHQPAGIALLFWPCAWSLALASGGMPPYSILLLYLLGAVVMRAAGCIINDLTDRKLDASVERTKNRPLASSAISPKQAYALLALLLLVAFAIALALGTPTLIGGLCAIPLIIAYPWMKRITWWPQLFLGLTFNWGALLGWVTITGHIAFPAILLYIAGIFWTLGYDTIYAHQDAKDDALIGIKSTALLFGENTRKFVLLFYMLSATFLWLAGMHVKMGLMFQIGIAFFALQLFWQVKKMDISDAKSCKTLFFSNALSGILPFIFAILG